MLQKKTLSVLILVVAGMTFLGCDKIAAVMDHSSPKKENPLLAMPAPEIPRGHP